MLTAITLSVGALGVMGAQSDTLGQTAKRPNIVFILADDLGCRDLSVEGSTFYESPHIDSIAEDGMRFTRGYANCSVCSPSRASIMTGKYPPNHGITDWIGASTGEAWRSAGRHDSLLPPAQEHNLRSSEITLAEALHDAGYHTFFAGKWHLGSKGSWPLDHGFDENAGGWDVGSPRGGYFAPWNNPNLPSGPNGQSLPVRLGEETASFIEAHVKQQPNTPFLAYLSFYSVHSPIQTTQELWRKYRDKASDAGLADSRFRFDRRLPVRQVQDNPIYAGMIESMDDAVGIVLKKLDDLNLRDNTIICFTSDNGGVSAGDASATSNLPFRGGKGRQWEGGIREPFYVVAPGVSTAGTTNNTPVIGSDFYPTLLELAGVGLPETHAVDGISFVPLLRGATIANRPLFWHYPHYGNQGGDPSSIIMRGDWKLIFYHEDGRNELYNLSADPGEQNSLASTDTERATAMRKELDEWLIGTNAPMAIPDPQFDQAKRTQRLKNIATAGMKRLEQNHKRYLDPNYKPNKGWWGSEQPTPIGEN